MAKPEVVVPLSTLYSPRDTLARPVRDLRISVMDRCNFRCPYCMPREKYHERYKFLGSHERLSFDEIVRLSRLFVRLGVRKLQTFESGTSDKARHEISATRNRCCRRLRDGWRLRTCVAANPGRGA